MNLVIEKTVSEGDRVAQKILLPSFSFPKGWDHKASLCFFLSCHTPVCKDIRLEKCSEKNTNVKIPAGLSAQGVEGNCKVSTLQN